MITTFHKIKSQFKVQTFYGTFLYKRLIFIVVSFLGDSLFAPLYTKLLGENLPIASISVIYLTCISAGLFVPLFKNISWRALLVLLYLSDACEITCYSLYFLFDKNLIYVALGFHIMSAIIGAITLSIYHTRQSNIISKAFAKDYEEFLVSVNVFQTASILAGYIITLLLNYIGGSYLVCMVGISILVVCCFLYTNLLKDLVALEKILKKNFSNATGTD